MSGHPPVGAAGAAQVPCSHPVGPAKQQHGIADKVRQFVLLSAEQCADLEHEMVAAEAARRNESATTSTLQHAPQPPQGGTPAKAASVCEVYYDNSSLLLTLRGWWLCEREGSWHLRMPVVNSRGNPEKPLMHYEDIIVPEDILDRVGLVQHADALRQGAAKSVERLLAQAGVLPFARFQTEERIYCREQEGGTVPRRQLTVIVHHVKFDVKAMIRNATSCSIRMSITGMLRTALSQTCSSNRVVRLGKLYRSPLRNSASQCRSVPKAQQLLLQRPLHGLTWKLLLAVLPRR